MGLFTGLALGASVIGGALSSRSSNRNSRRAAETSQQNTDANVGLARDIYSQNRQILSPFVGRGNAAGNQINALLGLGGGQQQCGPQAATLPGVGSQFGGGSAASYYGLGDTPGFQFSGNDLFYNGGFNPAAFGGQFGNSRGTATLPYGVPSQPNGLPAQGIQPTITNTTTGVPTAQTAQQAAEGAFDTFRNSTGFQFRLGEGLDAVGSTYAGIGGFQSGAALRGITDYGQNFASNEFGNFVNALGSQQAVGASAASSLAGVGQNFEGTVIDSNNFNAQNQIGAQLGRQNLLANTFGTLGGGAFRFLTGGR